MRRVVYILADGTKVYTLKEAQASGQPYKTDVEPVKQGAQSPQTLKLSAPAALATPGSYYTTTVHLLSREKVEKVAQNFFSRFVHSDY